MAVQYPLLELSDRQDLFSCAFILAVVGAAGYNYGGDRLDRGSEDLYVKHRSDSTFTPFYKRLAIQAKCTYNYKINNNGLIPFKLSRKNYEDLRTTSEPHILVVVTVPRQLKGCTEFRNDHLLLRHQAYWMSLRGSPPIKNPKQKTIVVQVPTSQRFTIDSLHTLMGMIAKGSKP